jgi:molybdenum cofactor sulfurtransferase
MIGGVYGNPHSGGGFASGATYTQVTEVRDMVLAFLGVDSTTHSVIFTSGATAALKLVGECFPWSPQSEFCHTLACHNSLLGVREYALAAGGSCRAVQLAARAADGMTTAAVYPRRSEAVAAELTVAGRDVECGVERGMERGTMSSAKGSATGSTAVSASDCATGSAKGSAKGSAECGAECDVMADEGDVFDGPQGEVKLVEVGKCDGQDDYEYEGSKVRVLEDGKDECEGSEERTVTCHLFGLPAECNFSGTKPDLGHIAAVRRRCCRTHGRWLVLLDAAKYCATSPLDLSRVDADFTALSFYKLFGYPTGLGALVVRNESAGFLEKRYFGGGTVDAAAAGAPLVILRQSVSARFEDGTISYLSIMALRHGMTWLQRDIGGMSVIQQHTSGLAANFQQRLAALSHGNGAAVCQLYGWDSTTETNAESPSEKLSKATPSLSPSPSPSTHGSIVAFNLLRPDGSFVGYAEVEKLAALHHIQLRTGCFCNAGACQLYLNLTLQDIESNIQAGHVCGDDKDLVDGRPTGAVRVSFGYMSLMDEVDTLMRFVERYFVVRDMSATEPYGNANPSESRQQSHHHPQQQPFIRAMYVYPVKSCFGMTVEDQWPLGPRGLLFDREWAVVDAATGSVLNQKAAPKLANIAAVVDLGERTLTLSLRRPVLAPHGFAPSVVVDLDPEVSLTDQPTTERAGERKVQTCAGGCNGIASRNGGEATAVSQWLKIALGRPCELVRNRPGDRWSQTKSSGQGSGSDGKRSDHSAKTARRAEIGFANEGQFLLITDASVGDVNRRAAAEQQTEEVKEHGEHGGGAVASGPLDGGGVDTETGAEVAEKEDQKASFVDWRITAATFRPNFVIGGTSRPFEEDAWTAIQFEGMPLLLRVTGPCSRCRMINIDQMTGEEGPVPLRTLARYRRKRVCSWMARWW